MERRRKSVGGDYENSCHDFDSFKTVHHSKKSLRNFDVIPPWQRGDFKKLLAVRGPEWKVLYAASSGAA